MSDDVTAGRAALALNEMLADPRGREVLRRLNALAPTWLADQGDGGGRRARMA
jgi:hypothetical protein